MFSGLLPYFILKASKEIFLDLYSLNDIFEQG